MQDGAERPQLEGAWLRVFSVRIGKGSGHPPGAWEREGITRGDLTIEDVPRGEERQSVAAWVGAGGGRGSPTAFS